LFEIGNNLRTLESQAKKAERYFSIKGEYKTVSIELAKASLEHFNEQYKTLNEQHDTGDGSKNTIGSNCCHRGSKRGAAEGEAYREEQELSGLQKQFNELVNRVRQLENDKKLAAQRLEHLKEREKNLRDFLAGAGGQSQKLEDSIAFSERQIAEETTGLEKIREELETLRKSVR
jgi:chromosome segregation protein